MIIFFVSAEIRMQNFEYLLQVGFMTSSDRLSVVNRPDPELYVFGEIDLS